MAIKYRTEVQLRTMDWKPYRVWDTEVQAREAAHDAMTEGWEGLAPTDDPTKFLPAWWPAAEIVCVVIKEQEVA